MDVQILGILHTVKYMFQTDLHGLGPNNLREMQPSHSSLQPGGSNWLPQINRYTMTVDGNKRKFKGGYFACDVGICVGTVSWVRPYETHSVHRAVYGILAAVGKDAAYFCCHEEAIPFSERLVTFEFSCFVSKAACVLLHPTQHDAQDEWHISG